MKKRLASGITFDASAQTVVHADFSDLTLAGIQLIINVTDNIVIYNFADPTKGGTLSTDTLTLEYDTTTMDDVDVLMVLVEDGVTTTALSAVDNAVLDAIALSLATLEGDTSNLGGIYAFLDALENAVAGNELQVDIVTMPGADVAHDAADSGNPVKKGHKAIDIGANPTDVAANDRSNSYGLRNGVPFQIGGAPNIVSKNLNVTDADGAQTDTALITVSAGTAIVVTKVSAMLDSATTATGGVAVRIGFGTANTPAADSAGIILAHPGISAGSGVVEGNGAGIIGMGATNEDLRLTCEDPAGGNLDIIVTYFTVAIG